MNLHPKLEQFLMTSCDQFFSAFPQKRPAKKLLEDCLIISHRGIHDQREIKENTMDAFVLAEEEDPSPDLCTPLPSSEWGD